MKNTGFRFSPFWVLAILLIVAAVVFTVAASPRVSSPSDITTRNRATVAGTTKRARSASATTKRAKGPSTSTAAAGSPGAHLSVAPPSSATTILVPEPTADAAVQTPAPATPQVLAPAPSTPKPTGPDPIVIAAGDIADCASQDDEATAKLVKDPSWTVITLGDTVYESGSHAEFLKCYDPSWGTLKTRTHPAVGNHEYLTPGAAGYFDYFGEAAGDPTRGYYSFDLGAWHIVVLNSNCSKVGGCDAASPQYAWLRSDLAAHPTACTMAAWHHPLFGSTGTYTDEVRMRPIWALLYNAGADVVLNGHAHNYERMAPQDAEGNPDQARGIREFIVGTGGKDHQAFEQTAPNSEVRNDDTFGVLKLTLHSGGYDWKFIPEAGGTFTDSGSGSCH